MKTKQQENSLFQNLAYWKESSVSPWFYSVIGWSACTYQLFLKEHVYDSKGIFRTRECNRLQRI